MRLCFDYKLQYNIKTPTDEYNFIEFDDYFNFLTELKADFIEQNLQLPIIRMNKPSRGIGKKLIENIKIVKDMGYEVLASIGGLTQNYVKFVQDANIDYMIVNYQVLDIAKQNFPDAKLIVDYPYMRFYTRLYNLCSDTQNKNKLDRVKKQVLPNLGKHYGLYNCSVLANDLREYDKERKCVFACSVNGTYCDPRSDIYWSDFPHTKNNIPWYNYDCESYPQGEDHYKNQDAFNNNLRNIDLAIVQFATYIPIDELKTLPIDLTKRLS